MNLNIDIPGEYKISFQRLIPYFPLSLRDDPEALESILLFLKVGGEKLARIAIEAFKQNQHLNDAEAQKQLREAALSVDLVSDAVDEDTEDEDETDDEAIEDG